MSASWTANLGIDKYTWQARMKPAIFIILPAFVTIAVWSPNSPWCK